MRGYWKKRSKKKYGANGTTEDYAPLKIINTYIKPLIDPQSIFEERFCRGIALGSTEQTHPYSITKGIEKKTALKTTTRIDTTEMLTSCFLVI